MPHRKDGGLAPRLLPVALGLVLIVVASRASAQILHPFLEHDDWNAILPADPARIVSMHARLLTDGRWLNYGWWRVIGVHLTPVTASVLFHLAYLAFVGRFAYRLAPGWLGLLAAAGLFVSPMISQTTYWPAVLAPSIVILALAVWTLPLCRHEVRRFAVWLLVFTALAVLAYPPVALVIFLALIVEEIDKSVRQLAVTAVIFTGCYVVSLVGVFTLNWLKFDHFGVVVGAWRDPNPVHGFEDVVENVGRYGEQWRATFEIATVPVLVGAAALIVCLVHPRTRHNGTVFGLALVVVGGLEAASTIVGGYGTPFRASAWVWIAIVVPIVWVARSSVRGLREAAVVGLVVTSVWGAVYWAAAVQDHQTRLDEYDRMEARLGRVIEHHPNARVLIYGNEADWDNALFRQEVVYFRSRTFDQHGVYPSYCQIPYCKVVDPAAVARQRPRRVWYLHRTIIVVPPLSTA